MRPSARIVAFASLTLMGFGAFGYGVAQAQNAQPAAPAAGTAPDLKRPVNLSPEEMNKGGDSAVARVELAATTVRRMLEKARQERDVVKTLCLNDKLNQLDVTLRSARERKNALEAAIARKDNDLAGHEFTIMGVYRSRSDRLMAEANQCVGSEIGFIGDTAVTTSVDPTIPDDEVGPPPVPFTPVTIPPPVAASPATLGRRGHVATRSAGGPGASVFLPEVSGFFDENATSDAVGAVRARGFTADQRCRAGAGSPSRRGRHVATRQPLPRRAWHPDGSLEHPAGCGRELRLRLEPLPAFRQPGLERCRSRARRRRVQAQHHAVHQHRSPDGPDASVLRAVRLRGALVLRVLQGHEGHDGRHLRQPQRRRRSVRQAHVRAWPAVERRYSRRPCSVHPAWWLRRSERLVQPHRPQRWRRRAVGSWWRPVRVARRLRSHVQLLRGGRLQAVQQLRPLDRLDGHVAVPAAHVDLLGFEAHPHPVHLRELAAGQRRRRQHARRRQRPRHERVRLPRRGRLGLHGVRQRGRLRQLRRPGGGPLLPDGAAPQGGRARSLPDDHHARLHA